MMPEISELALSSNVPDGELESLVINFLDIEPDGWDSGGAFLELHLIENGSLAGTVKSEHEDFGLHV